MKGRRDLIERCVELITERVKDDERELQEFIWEVVEKKTNQELANLLNYR